MSHFGIRLSLVLLASVVIFAAGAHLGRVSPETGTDFNEETYRRMAAVCQLWSAVAYFSAHVENAESDWSHVLPRYLKSASKATTDRELILLLRQMLAELKDGHTDVVSAHGELPPRWSPDIRLCRIAGSTVVRSVGVSLRRDGSGIKPGQIVRTIDGTTVADALAQQIPYVSASTHAQLMVKAYQNVLLDKRGEPIRLELITAEGKRMVETLPRDSSPYFAGKPYAPSSTVYNLDGYRVGFIALESFADETAVSRFRAQLESCVTCDGLILDLRENGGGNDLYAYRAASYLADAPLRGIVLRHRRHERNRINQWITNGPAIVNPSEEFTYSGPLVVLVGARTESAAEDFAVMLQQSGRAVVVGERTAGSTGQPVFLRIPEVGVFRICAVQCTKEDGKSIQIVPDVEVGPTIRGLLEQQDEILDRGKEEIRTLIPANASNPSDAPGKASGLRNR